MDLASGRRTAPRPSIGLGVVGRLALGMWMGGIGNTVGIGVEPIDWA
jgi:hypothetical protein